ncbi:MAG: hypothetical protein A2X84_08735 [Desulfuromonadaceae bacterium GWC2_58_13]|nr:MAG: hypothetical protein A2X84_08735 [Desulfuromonadaceae bacterium GWC2_58_13]
MAGGYPFVITVASEKGGVGKTTIASNLAVYLKALDEDLPVTIASFDNHFSVDSMFAIGSNPGESVAGLFHGIPAAQLVSMGEYGVQFLASDSALTPPGDDPAWLAGALGDSGLPGILIFDTRPILDYFTRSALLAADLVLVPVKDRPSLINTASLARTLREADQSLDKMWLLPSLIDSRLRLRDNLGVREFLVFAAEERGYQVLDLFIAKSPKVESLVTNLSNRVYPVLTHARGTLVHRQLRDLSRFVLDRFRAAELPLNQRKASFAEAPTRRLRRLATACPVCGATMNGAEGQLFQDLRSRRRGFLHRACLLALLGRTGFADRLPEQGILVLSTTTTGMECDDATMLMHLYDAEGAECAVESVPDFFDTPFAEFWSQVSGRLPEELYREFLLVGLDAGPPGRLLSGSGSRLWIRMRRKVLREVLARVN